MEYKKVKETKAKVAKGEILKIFPRAKLTFMPLDNTSFESVRAFVKVFHEKFDGLICFSTMQASWGYLGPENGLTGAPKKDKIGGNGNDAKMAKTLWNFSEKAIKEKFDI